MSFVNITTVGIIVSNYGIYDSIVFVIMLVLEGVPFFPDLLATKIQKHTSQKLKEPGW